ncbi:MAG: hypothetical protein ACSHX8_11145 [Opitutaceae bacterium]
MNKLIISLIFLSCNLSSAQNLIGTIEKTNDSLYKKHIDGSILVPDLNNFKEGQKVQFTSDHFIGKFRTYTIIYISKDEAVLESQTTGRFSEKLYINRAEKKFTICYIQQEINNDYGDKYGFSISTIQGSFK